MWIIELAFYILYALFWLNVFDMEDHGIKLDIWLISWIFIAFFVIPFLTGRFFINITIQIKKSIFLLFLINTIFIATFAGIFVAFTSNEHEFLKFIDFAIVWFPTAMLFSLILLAGLLCNKKNRAAIKQGRQESKDIG